MGSSPDQVKPNTIKLVFVASSAKHAALQRNNKDWLARNQNNVWGNSPIWTVVSVSEHYKNQTRCVGLVKRGPHDQLTEN
jgi:hypothetical protein